MHAHCHTRTHARAWPRRYQLAWSHEPLPRAASWSSAATTTRTTRSLLGGTTSDRTLPARTYQWTTGTFSLFLGRYHAVALELTQGKAWTWGDISSSTPSCSSPQVNYGSTPVALNSLTGVTSVSVGQNYVQALLSDGTVWGWGGSSVQVGTSQSGASGNCAPLKVQLP